MKRTKKVLTGAVVMLLILAVLTGCGTGGGATGGGAVDEGENNGIVVGVSHAGDGNDWAASAYYHYQYALLERYGDEIAEVVWAAFNHDDDRQIADIEMMIARDVDILFVDPNSETAVVAVMEMAADAGIETVVLHGTVQTEAFTGFIARNNVRAGEIYAQFVVDQIDGEGNVLVIMGFPGSGYSEDVLQGVENVLARYPDVNLLGIEYAFYNPAESVQIVETYLGMGETIDGFIVDGGLMAFGVLQAFSERGMTIPPVTADDWTGFLRLARSLDFSDFIVISSGNELALDAVELGMRIMRGESFQRIEQREPTVWTGEEAIGLIRDDMPDSFWLATQISDGSLSQFFD